MGVLRSALRQREGRIGDASRAMQPRHKALEQMHGQLTEGVSDSTGKTGMTISRLILAGERDAETVAKPRDPRCKQDQATLIKAFQGPWRQDHVFALAHAVAREDFFHEHRCAGDQQIAACLKTCEVKAAIEEASPQPRRRQGNPPDCAVWTSLSQMTGGDLTQIDGLDVLGALQVIREIGLAMTRGPTGKQCASWLGLCPGNTISGGQRYRSRPKPTANRAAAACRMAAQTLSHRHRAFGAYYRRMRARLGAPKAMTATAHTFARVFESMLRPGVSSVDVGQHVYEQQYRERTVKNLKRSAQAFGFTRVPLEERTHEPAAVPS